MVRMGFVIALAVAVLGTALGGVTRATEPDGKTAIRYEWTRPSNGVDATPRLRLSIRSILPLSETTLNFRAPTSIVLRLANSAGVAIPAEIAAALESRVHEGIVPIGAMDAGRVVILEFLVEAPPQGPGGIVTFGVEAKDRLGLPVREGTGVPVGPIGPTPTVRDGAAEYPASRPGDRQP